MLRCTNFHFQSTSFCVACICIGLVASNFYFKQKHTDHVSLNMSLNILIAYKNETEIKPYCLTHLTCCLTLVVTNSDF